MIVSFFTYIVLCADTTYYVGWTTNVERRLQQHNGVRAGGAKYTKAKRPVVLSYFEKNQTKSEAMKREYQLKQLTHIQKRHLCDQWRKSHSIDSIL